MAGGGGGHQAERAFLFRLEKCLYSIGLGWNSPPSMLAPFPRVVTWGFTCQQPFLQNSLATRFQFSLGQPLLLHRQSTWHGARGKRPAPAARRGHVTQIGPCPNQFIQSRSFLDSSRMIWKEAYSFRRVVRLVKRNPGARGSQLCQHLERACLRKKLV